MNPEKIGKQIIKRLLMEEEMTKVSIYPGAFKPPHKGHVETALRSIDDKTNKVIIFMSTKERENVDVEEAKQVWDLYKANIPELEKVEIQLTPTPVKAVYDYAKDNPTHDIRAVFGKGEEERFKSLLDKEKYPHVEVFDAGTVGDFSATTLRQAIRDKDLETIKDYIPYLINVDDFLSIFKTDSLKEDKEIELDDKEQEIVNDILSSISEGATATRVIDKFKDYSRKGLLTMSIILGVIQGLEAQDTIKSDIDKIQQTGTELVQQKGGNTVVLNQKVYDLEARKAKSLLGSEYEKYEEFAQKYNLIMIVMETPRPYDQIPQMRMLGRAKKIATDPNTGMKYWDIFTVAKSIQKDGDIIIRMYVTNNDDLNAVSDIEINEAIVGDEIVCDNCGWNWKIVDGGDDLFICHKCGYDNNPLLEEDPKKGTGKKPKGSGRRLYTDEDPSDTVKIKFSTRQDIVDTLNKTTFKNKSHARKSQVINLIHQRVRAALGRTKDPLKKAKLKSAFEYIKKRKEASKKKTQRLKKEDRYLQEARYKKFLNESWDDSKAKIINKFMDYTTDYLSIDRPKIKLINQGDYTQQHRSFGGYSPSDQKIMVVVHNRNMADILRTLAHELVHHMQNLDNRLTPKSGEDGSPDENEANSLAAVIMRKFGRENPDIYE